MSEREESYLITVPDVAEIRFAQDNKTSSAGLASPNRAQPLPYEFSHRERAALWVMKVPSALLRSRIAPAGASRDAPV